MSYIGVIIEESLVKKDVLKDLKILSTRIEKVTPEHETPWLEQWTLHYVEISEDQAQVFAQKISESLDTSKGHWYADFKNSDNHYIVFKDKIFKVDRYKQEQYDEVKKYGMSIGIPEHQVIFKAKK